MQIMILDIEGTGLHSSTLTDNEGTVVRRADDIVQFAGIITDMSFNVKTVFNRYCFTGKEFHPKAGKVTGLDDSKLLYKLSDGKPFEDVVYELKGLWENEPTIFIAYNIQYDKLMITTSLARYNLKIDFGQTIGVLSKTLPEANYHMCAMNTLCDALYMGHGGKRILLPFSEIIKRSMDVEKTFSELQYILPKLKSITVNRLEFHDAFVDSFFLYRLLKTHESRLFS